MMPVLVCIHCNSYLLEHPENKAFRKCIGCGWCVDNEGFNKLNTKPIQEKSKCSCADYESGKGCRACEKSND